MPKRESPEVQCNQFRLRYLVCTKCQRGFHLARHASIQMPGLRLIAPIVLVALSILAFALPAYSQLIDTGPSVCNPPAEVGHIPPHSNPTSLRAALDRGNVLQQGGAFAQAESCYRRAFALDPSSLEAIIRLAEILGVQKETGAAVNYWRLAMERNPGNQQIALSLGIALLDENHDEEAAKVLGALAQRSVSTGLPALNYGSALSRLGRYTEAITAYQQALQFRDAADPARLSLAKIFVTLVRYQEAKSLLDAYLPDHPSSADAHFCLGLVQYKLGSLSDAEVELKKAIALHAEEKDAQFYLGSVLMEEGKFEEAVLPLRRASDLEPHKNEIYFQLSRLYQKMKLPDQARAEVRKMQEEQDLSTQDLRAVVLAHDAETEASLGHNDKAAELYRRIVEMQPSNSKSHYDLAVIYGLLGNVAAERAILLKAQHLEPEFAPIFNQLGVLDMNEEQAASAEARFKKALSIEPGFVPALGNLGVLYGRTGRLAEAEHCLRLAVENDPTYATGYVNLGLILAAEGQREAALASVSNGLALAPKDAAGQRALALLQAGTAAHENQR